MRMIMMAHNQEVWTWSQWQQQQQQHCDNPTLEAMNPCPPLQNLYPKPKTSICLNMRIFFFLENPLPTNHYWAKILGGELKSYNCRSQSQKSFNPDWWRLKSSLLISINTHIHTHFCFKQGISTFDFSFATTATTRCRPHWSYCRCLDRSKQPC